MTDEIYNWHHRISNWQIGHNLNYSTELISYYMRCNADPVNVMVNAEFINHCNERRYFAATKYNSVEKLTNNEVYVFDVS